MGYSPGVVDRSGEIRAQGMLQGGQGLLGGFEAGMEELKKLKEKEKTGQATIKAAELMSKGLGAVAGQLGPEYQTSLQELQTILADPSLSTDKKSMIAESSLKSITELLGSGVKLKQLKQQADHQKAIQDLQRLRLEQGPAPTEAQRTTEAIIEARIKAGLLDPNDKRAIAQERAKLLALGGRDERTGQPFQGMGQAQDADGNWAGVMVVDQRTGEVKLVKPGSAAGSPKDGQNPAGGAQVPVGVKPTTASGINRAVLNGNDFLKLRAQVTDDEISLGRFSRYIENVENAAQGIETIADRFATAYKTFTDSGQLTQAQIAQARANGQLQGLIGQSRLDVLGGGVLTEQDAVRIIDYLGGDSGSLRNKELVKKAISDIYQDKYKRYSRGLEDYNTQVKNYYGGHGYKPVDAAKYDERMFSVVPAEKEVTPEKEMAQLDKEMAAIRARIEKLKAGSKK